MKLLEFWDARYPTGKPGNLFRGPMGPVLLDGIDVTNRCFRIERWDDGTQCVLLYRKDDAGQFIAEGNDVATERRFGRVEFPD
jgi:hypothetical protein